MKHCIKYNIISDLLSILVNNTESTVSFYNVYPRVLRLTASTTPVLIDDDVDEWNNVTLNFKSVDNRNHYWETEEDFKIIILSDKVMQGLIGDLLISLNGFGVIAFYAVIVVAIGQLIRNIFSSKPWMILYDEMPNSEDLLYLCEGIYTARYLKYTGHLKDEYLLTKFMLQLYRSPEIMVQITRLKYE